MISLSVFIFAAVGISVVLVFVDDIEDRLRMALVALSMLSGPGTLIVGSKLVGNFLLQREKRLKVETYAQKS